MKFSKYYGVFLLGSGIVLRCESVPENFKSYEEAEEKLVEYLSNQDSSRREKKSYVILQVYEADGFYYW